MFAVIFLVEPKTERWNNYLDLAKFLKPRLEAVDGFIDNERFASLHRRGRLLSLSTWRDETAVVRWRTHGEHHSVQEKGRFEIFSDYRLRVGEITNDTQPPAAMTVPASRLDETEIGEAKIATITELTPEAGSAAKGDTFANQLGLDPGREGLADMETFESIYSPGKLLLLGLWRNADAANAWKPARPTGTATMRQRQVRIIRDYGMFDRREAPQYYPAIDPAQHRAAQ